MRKNLLVQYTIISFLMTLSVGYVLGLFLIREIRNHTVLVRGDFYHSLIEEIPNNYREILPLFGLEGGESGEPDDHGSHGDLENSHFVTDLFQFPTLLSLRIFDRKDNLLLEQGQQLPTLTAEIPWDKPVNRRRSDYVYEILAEEPAFIIRFHLPIEYGGERIGYAEIIEEDGKLPLLLTESRRTVYLFILAGGFVFYVSLFLLFLRSYTNQKRTIRRLDESQSLTIVTMSRLAELRDDNTGVHIKRTSRYCRLLAEELRKSDKYRNYITREYLEDLERSAPLHDIGKVGIPDSILQKPGKLTGEEFAVIQTHPLLGAHVLEMAMKSLDFLSYFELAHQIVKYHHENWNGTGYPEGLSGEAIPLSARIMAFADVYDALTTKRPYKDPFTHESALAFIERERGKKFDPELTDLFLSLSDELKKVSEEFGNDA